MHRAYAARDTPSPPPAPAHTGAPLVVGEFCLLRRPDSWYDVMCELRAIDNNIALVFFRGLDRSEIVPLSCLRRA